MGVRGVVMGVLGRELQGVIFEKVLSARDSQLLVDAVCQHWNLRPITVVRGRPNTVRIDGSALLWKRYIRVNRPSAALIMHEVAHFLAYDKQHDMGHGRWFRYFEHVLARELQHVVASLPESTTQEFFMAACTMPRRVVGTTVAIEV